MRVDNGLPGQIGPEVVRILLLEDRDADAELVERALRKAGFAYLFERARGEPDFLAKLDPAPHVIVSDYYVPGCDALHALRLVRSRGLDIPFILVSGVIGETRALEALRLGATDFLLKDRLGRLGSAIRTALEVAALRRKAATSTRQKPDQGENEFREAFASAAIGMALTTLDGRWLQVNRAFSELTGYRGDELQQRDCHSIMHPDDVAEDIDLLRQMLAGKINVSQRETRYLHKQGHVVWAQCTASLTRDGSGQPLHRALQLVDITERKRTEARLARVDRARKVMAGCSHALVHAVDEQQFLQEICRVVVESGGYVQAYIGLAEEDELKSVRPVASAGFEEGYLEQTRRSWSKEGRRQSVMGGVIATGMRYISRDIFADAKLGRWVERARARGYQSLICVPLRIDNRSIGGISIYAREPNSFDYEEIELLELLARDISYGMASLRARAALRESEEHFRATFEQAAAGIAHTTTEGRFLQVNRTLCEMVGYSPEEMRTLTTRDLTHPDDRDKQDALRRDLLEGRRSVFAGEKRYVRKDGPEIWVSRTVTMARPRAGEPYLIQVFQDISERKRTEARLERLMRARRVMAECDHTLVHIVDETEMLHKMCRIVVESGGYKMAWVGLATGDAKKPVYPAAHAGFGDVAPMTHTADWEADGRYRGFMVDVITTGNPHIARDILHDTRHAARRDRAAQRGFQSSIALPLQSGGAILGAIAIYAREADAFDEEEIALLTELTSDIAYGIDNLRTRIAREQAERAAHDNERRLKESFEQAAVGISRVGLDGVLVEVNQKFCDMLGYTKAELIGKAIRDITHPDDYGRGSVYRSQLKAGETRAVAGDKRFVRKDGSVMWGRRTMSAALDDAGNPQYVISVVEDITERKEIERRFELTFDHAAVGMVLTGLDGRYMQVNQSFADMLGYTREEIIGQPVLKFAQPGHEAEVSQIRNKLLSGEVDSATGERWFIRKDGRVAVGNRTLSLARNAAGEPLYFISVVEDVTETKLREQHYRAMFHNAAVGITRVDLNGILVDANQKFCDMLGYAWEELCGKAIKDITHPDDFVQGAQFRTQLAHGDARSAAGEKRFVRKDGTVIWARRTMSTATDEAGNAQYVISVVEDITERKELERRFELTFNHAAVGMTLTGLDGRLMQVNQKYAEMLGYTRDELRGMSSEVLTHPEDKEETAQIRESLIKGRVESATGEKRLIRKDQRVIWVRRSVSVARNVAGEPLYFVAVVDDITDRKEAAERYRATFEHAPVGIMHTSIDGDRILHANSKLCEMLGYTHDELVSMVTDQIIHRDHVGVDRSKYRDKMLAGEVDTLSSERLYQRKDGSNLWVDRTVSLARDWAGTPLYFIRIIEDISERKMAARRQAMEHAVTRVLAESPTVDEALPQLLRVLCESLEWACGAYWNWDEATEVLSCVRTWHIDAEGIAEFAAASRDGANEAKAWRNGSPPGAGTGGGMVRTVWHSGEPVWFPDVAQRPDFRRAKMAAAANLHCAFGFPVLAGGHPMGVMEFYGRDIKEPDESLLQIVRAIGSQVGQFVQQKHAERALRLSEERYRDQFEASPLPMWVWDDESFAFLDVNQAAVDHYGYSRSEFLQMTVRHIWAPEESARYEENLRGRERVRTLNLRRKHRTKDGRIIDVEVTARLFMREGRPVWLTLVNDISVRLRAEGALQESEEQFRQLANNIPQVFWITDVRQKGTLYLSPAAEALIGQPLQKIRDNPRILVSSLHHEDRSRVHIARQTAAAGGYDETYRIVRPDGSIRWVHDRAFPVRDASGAVYRIAGIAEDITERKLAEERLMHLAHYDVLTSLPNRVLFYDRLRQALAQAKRNEWVVGVMLIDVDRFKNVNDTLGHAVGDQLLQQVSERLTMSVRSGDTVGRLGGDEFAVVLSNLATAQDGSLVAQKIMTSFKEPFRLEGGSEIYVTASIGITLYPHDSTDQDTLIKNADAAMYRSKELGRNAYRFYTPEMNARALELLSMESSLRRALDRREFLLHYQPKVSVASGDIVGVEALLRWRHPDRGLVPPDEFMPVLEETGLIVSVGEWVIAAACEQIAEWSRMGIEPKPVAINLSARQFANRDLGTTIKRLLEENDIAPELIEFEITESSVMTNTEESTGTLEFLGRLGVGLSIDDFGTGYSSLGYLKRFPLDALKIDRSFIRDITTSTDDATITRAVISMAHSLGLKVIAEGVETLEQVRFLAEHGCDQFQGYYFSSPLPAYECGVWLKEKRTLPREGLQRKIGVTS